MKDTLRRFTVVLLLFCVLLSCGCTDLGAFEDEQAFYDSFGDISFVCPSSTSIKPEIRDYSLSEITNKETQNDNKTVMNEEYYKYIVFQLKSEVKADDLSFWFITEKEFSGNVQAEFYLSNSFSSSTEFFKDASRDLFAGRYEKKTSNGVTDSVEYLNLDGYGTADDGYSHTAAYQKSTFGGTVTVTFTLSYKEGEETRTIAYRCETEEPYAAVTVYKDGALIGEEYTYVEEYDTKPEAGLTNLIATDAAYAKQNQWTSFFVERWSENGVGSSSTITIPKDSYIYVKILNNCSGGYRKKLTPIAFRANNLMLRVVED